MSKVDEYARSINIKSFISSAKENININNIFLYISTEIYSQFPINDDNIDDKCEQVINDKHNLSKENRFSNEKKSTCC